jgi:chemotaxis protein MotB
MARKPMLTRRMRRHEEHTNHESWAIPYGDLVTLLLAFFVVMYAISSVNAGKYRVLSDSLFAAFRGSPRTMNPIQIGEDQNGAGAQIDSAIIQSQLQGQQRTSLAPVPVDGANKNSGDQSTLANRNKAHAAAAQALTKVADDVAAALSDLVKQDLVVVRRSEFWIEVEIKTDILYPSGSAQLAPYAVDVIQRLGSALGPYPNPIRVEGHTDNKPIKTVAFMSNWELSAARAGSVVRVLQSRGVGPERLAVIGYGENRPLKPNDTEDGRNANRRVVVVILSTELQRKTTGDTADNQQATNQPIQPAVAAPAPAPAVAPPINAPVATPGEAAELPSATPATPPVATANVTLSTTGARAAGSGMVPAP